MADLEFQLEKSLSVLFARFCVVICRCGAFANRPFSDTAAVLNFLDLRSIMGCPGGHSLSIYACFSGKKRTSMYVLGKKAIIITSNHGTKIFFSHYNLFLGKLKEKLSRKARVNTDVSISERAHTPGHPIILLKFN